MISSSGCPVARLNPAQQHVARQIISEGHRIGAPRHVIKVAVATWLTENPSLVSGGDRDSEGPFQQRPSTGWGPASESNRTDARQFYQHAIPLFHRGVRGGQLAQAVQRSAYPGRYQPNLRTAGSILRGMSGMTQAAPQTTTQQQVVRQAAPTVALQNPLQPAVPLASPVLPDQRPGETERRKAKKTEGVVPMNQQGQVVKETTTTTPAPVQPQKGVLAPFKAAARALEKQHLPYTWGGGHSPSGRPAPGLDCSGAVRWVLNKAGINTPSMVASQFKSYGKPGPGLVTIYASDRHVFMKIGNKFFGTSRTNPAGGPGIIEGGEDTGGYTVRHIPLSGDQAQALAKQAKPVTKVKFTGAIQTQAPIFSSRPIAPDTSSTSPFRTSNRRATGLEAILRRTF